MKNIVKGWSKVNLLTEGRKLVRMTASHIAGPISLKQAKLALLNMSYETYLKMPREGLAGTCAYHELLRKARTYQ